MSGGCLTNYGLTKAANQRGQSRRREVEVHAPPGVTQPAAFLDTYDVHGCPEGGTICCGDSGASHHVGPGAELLVSP